MKGFIENKLDVRHVLHTMMEIEKFKQLFFDEDQYYIFNHLPRPLVYSRFVYKTDPKKREKQGFRLSYMEGFWRQVPGDHNGDLRYLRSVENIKKKEILDIIDERIIDMIE